MAGTTGRGGVQTRERETGQIVIERNGLEPGGLQVTGAAFLLHFAAVRIVHCVTAAAG